jgi:hypothetical protein
LCECNAGQVSPKHVYVQIGNISQQQGCAIFHLLLGSRNRSPLKENGICCSGQLSFCGTLQTTVLLRKVTEYLHTCAHSQFDTGCIRALALAVWFRWRSKELTSDFYNPRPPLPPPPPPLPPGAATSGYVFFSIFSNSELNGFEDSYSVKAIKL